MEPEQFGDYTLVRCLAIGGMGELYLAQRGGVAGFSKQLVVKRIRPELAGDAEFVEMFLNEGRLAAMLDHPNVVHIYELGQVEDSFFIAMEYVAGKNLGTVLAHNGGPLELSVALGVINGICEGIAFAHDAVGMDGQPLNLVHRDINPQNVLISYSGTVKIADFGIAKAHIQQRKETQVGVLKGKFGYLSPEQARSGAIDRRSDIYTLGLLLFEATVGQPAIPGKSDTQLLYAAAEGIVQRPTDFVPSYPRALEQIYLRATAKEPVARYQTAKELQEDLLAFQLDQRLVVTSSKLAELMRRLFGGDSTGERRLPTPARTGAARDTPGLQARQVRPASHQIRPSRPGLDPDEPGLHQAPTVMEDRSQPAAHAGARPAPRAIAAGPISANPSEDQTLLSRAPSAPEIEGLASAATQMLDRSQPAVDPGAAASGGAAADLGPQLHDAATQLHQTEGAAAGEARDEDPDELRITDPHPRAAIPFQPPIPVEAGDQPRSRWVVILISTIVTLLLGGGAAYYFLVRPDLRGWLGQGGDQPPVKKTTRGPTKTPTRTPGKTGPTEPVARDGGAASGVRTRSMDGGGAATAAPDARAATSTAGSSADAAATTAANTAARVDAAGAPPPARAPDARAVSPPSHVDLRNKVAISSKPSVTLYWHGNSVGRTPCTVELPPGKQRLLLRNRDLEIKVARTITVPRRGVSARVDLLVEQGALVVKARPWAHVEINGVRRGTTPIPPIKLYEGDYTVVLKNTEHGDHTMKVSIRPGETNRLVHVFK